ncbi:MAG: hypothetical protein JST84_28450 [Acidobacteria bacterium]|nr:hypothetical protein [Acidobacteriota bacterium]
MNTITVPIPTREMNRQWLEIAWRAFVIWLVIIGAEFIHGILRVLLLEPRVGDFRARQIAVFSGAMIICTIAFIFVHWLKACRITELLFIGVFWLVLTIAFELILGRAILGLSWERVLSDYDLMHGGLLPFGMLILMFSPYIAGKLRGIV